MDRARLALLILGGVVSAGCKPTVEELIDEHRPPVEETVRRASWVRHAMETQPLLTKNGADGRGAVLGGPHVTSANAAWVYLEDLATPGLLSRLPRFERIWSSDALSNCAALVAHGTDALHPDERPSGSGGRADRAWLEQTLRFCSRLSHLVVIRTVAFAPPSALRIVSAEEWAPGNEYLACSSKEATCSFDGGYAKAEVHLFSLRPVRHLGGYTVEVESAESVSFTGEFRDAARQDFMTDLRAAILVGASRYLSGAKLL